MQQDPIANTPGPQPNSYDQVPYPSGAYPQSHPGRLFAIGTLFNMRPTALERCRILELGCADGSNLVPLAQELPEAQLLGIDLSPRQVAMGRETVEKLGLKNIQLECRDIMTLGEEMGRFDYIIAHGVFSWVPREAQERVLGLCRQLLADRGIAYISYNTYPGWHMRGMLRRMMLYHTSHVADSSQHIAQARALVQFLAGAVPKENDPYGMLLHTELERMQSWDDGYLRHDALEEVNEPVYFHEFINRARAHRLRYLGEAEFHTMVGQNLPAHIGETLRRITSDIIQTEQYLDFVRNRMFRQTLLCREEIELERRVTSDRLRGLWVSAPLTPEPAGAPGELPAVFGHTGGGTIRPGARIVRAGMWRLAESWPAAIEISHLFEEAWQRIDARPEGGGPAESMTALSNTLLECYSRGLVELSGVPTPCVTRPGERPIASPLARLQAQRSPLVTSLRHATAQLDAVHAYLLPLLDGTCTRQELLQHLLSAAKSGTITIRENNLPVQDEQRLTPLLQQGIDTALDRLARAALLVG